MQAILTTHTEIPVPEVYGVVDDHDTLQESPTVQFESWSTHPTTAGALPHDFDRSRCPVAKMGGDRGIVSECPAEETTPRRFPGSSEDDHVRVQIGSLRGDHFLDEEATADDDLGRTVVEEGRDRRRDLGFVGGTAVLKEVHVQDVEVGVIVTSGESIGVL